MTTLPRCELLATCAAPPLVVDLHHKGDMTPARICALHIRDARALGFAVAVTDPAMTVTAWVSAQTRALADAGISIPWNAWEEITGAPREWCPVGCKIHARRFGTGVSFKLFHSATYGCPAGAR